MPSTAVSRSSAARSKVGGSGAGPFPSSTVIRVTPGDSEAAALARPLWRARWLIALCTLAPLSSDLGTSHVRGEGHLHRLGHV